jgi:hypothetical protein
MSDAIKGAWYSMTPRSTFRKGVHHIILVHVLDKKEMNYGDPFSKVKVMRMVCFCREYQIISDSEGIDISIESEKIPDADFFSKYTRYSPAKTIHFRRFMKLLMSGAKINKTEIH